MIDAPEPVTAYDESCDYCAKQVGMARLRQVRVGRSVSWLCDACYARQQERYAAMTAEERAEVSA